MAIKSFTYEPALTDLFVRYGYEIYQGDSNWIPPFREEVHAQLSPKFPFYQKPGNSHRHFLAFSGERMVGRISAMVNGDLKERDGTPVGTVGFFESIDDYSVAHDLLDSAVAWLCEDKRIKRIWGPMNFDIWHDHRFMTRGFDQKPFYGEPYNKPYYPGFFERYGFSSKQEWDSVEITGRDTLTKIIARGAERYKLLIKRGYRFDLFDVRNFKEELRKLHAIISKSFGGFLGFTPIPFAEFERLFAKSRYAFDSRFCVLAYDEKDTLAGFATAFIELADAIRGMKGKNNLVSKLRFLHNRRKAHRINFYIGGVIPEEVEKRSGLGRAGFYYTIKQILDAGFETLLLTLRVKGNLAHGLLGRNAPEPQREYILYELNR